MNRLTTPGLRQARVRTTATAMAVVVVVVCLAGIGVIRLFEREQIRQLDDRLQSATDFVDQAQEAGTQLQGEPGRDDFIQVISPDGDVVFASDLLADAPALMDAEDLADAPEAIRTVSVDGVGDLRTITAPLNGNTLLLGQPLSDVDDAVDSLTRSLFIGLPFLVLGLGAIIWLVVGRALRPADQAVRREKQLIADASHDLRSPLAGVRALLETEPDDPAELEQNRMDALATLSRLEVIAEDLLVLARSDRDGAQVADQRLVDLDEVVLRQVHVVERNATASIDITGLSAGQVTGIERDLERLVENLLANAVRHARSQIEVTLVETDGQVRLTVADDGPGIPEADRARVFDRFTRLDASRTAGDGGAGLGLAIVRSVAAAHGGTVTVTDAALGGAAFVVVLPASLRNPVPVA